MIERNNVYYQKITDASITLGISKYTLRKWIKEDKIPYIKAGQRYLVDVEGTLLACRNEARFKYD